MSTLTKIQPPHQARQAVVYVRQSTTRQLAVNQESTRRQYQLADRAQALGWPRPRIAVIDDDLGLSGASSQQRVGFQRLVTALSLGEVGAIFVTEVSRLSRLNSDWHRVIELCAVFDTLIADEDGVYDPADPNDRLVLGLKGTLFAAELHILRARMRGGLLNKARRGALALRLPVGYRRLPDGTVILDPDEAVRTTLATIFTQFAQLGSARAVQRYLYTHHLRMPRLVQIGPDTGQLRWVTPTYQGPVGLCGGDREARTFRLWIGRAGVRLVRRRIRNSPHGDAVSPQIHGEFGHHRTTQQNPPQGALKGMLDGMKTDMIGDPTPIRALLPRPLLSYRQAVERALIKETL